LLKLYEDRRIGGSPRLYLAEERDDLMLVPEEIKKCVVFLCYRAGAQIMLAGTGFFLAAPSSIAGKVYIYLVTARHVVEAIQQRGTDGHVLVRLNSIDGGATLISSVAESWRFHPSDSRADVAAIQWTPDRGKFDYRAIPTSMLVTGDIENEHSIGPGDEVFFPGLFVNHYGQKRNLPIIRVGNIAAMAEEPVSTKAYGEIDAYLVEARSIGGLSGSPVFVNLRPGRGGIFEAGAPGFYLMGLMHGHYESPLTDEDMLLEDEEHMERVNMGIAIVVPTGKIRDVIDQDEFVGERHVADDVERQRSAAVPD